MKRALTSLTGIAAVLSLTGCTVKDAFTIADTDGNGTLSLAVFDRFMLEAVYTEYDADGDGKVTAAEYAAANPSGKMFDSIDADGDGGVTPAEAKAFSHEKGTFAELFGKIDTDKDGAITRSEAETFNTLVNESEGSTRLEKLSDANAAS